MFSAQPISVIHTVPARSPFIASMLIHVQPWPQRNMVPGIGLSNQRMGLVPSAASCGRRDTWARLIWKEADTATAASGAVRPA